VPKNGNLKSWEKIPLSPPSQKHGNSKIEYRNSKQIQMKKYESPKRKKSSLGTAVFWILRFRILALFRISIVGFLTFASSSIAKNQIAKK